MKSDLRRWKKDKKRREEFLKSKHIKSHQRDVITQTDKSMGINHILIMIGMVIAVLAFFLLRMG